MKSPVALLFASFACFAGQFAAAAPALPAKELDVICAPIASLAPTKLPLKLEPGARVALIGNGLFERMQEHGWFEAMLLQRFPKEELVIRTLAWPADEVAVMPRPEDYGDIHKHLAAAKADVILAAYGFNESFKGAAALPDFERNLAALLVSLKLHRYNGKSAPQIVLVSPIAHEDLKNPNLPDGRASNERLKLYTEAMARVAKKCGVAFVDVFDAMRAAMEAKARRSGAGVPPASTSVSPAPTTTGTVAQAGETPAPLTDNGVRLNDAGYRVFAEELFRGLVGETAPTVSGQLKAAVEERNKQFLITYRPLNGFYITGGRKEPYGVVNFPGEIEKSTQMTANRDRRAWDIALGRPVPPQVDDSNTRPLEKITGDRPINEWLKAGDEVKQFNIDPRFNVNLFASEDQFPDLAKPIQMRWDTRGRLWVSCSQTYPQVTPGEKPNDKIVILEDTDGDGRADKCSVFATGLDIPLSFEFGDGGLYVSEQPHLTFLKDTDGDGKADVRRMIYTGFGTEDSHHALHDFTWTPEGDLIFRESIFHHSSVETPYGPVRARDSSFFRYRPATQRLLGFGSYYSTNPWGLTFDEWGWHLGSHPVFAAAVHSLNPPYPAQQPNVKFPAYSGTCGQDFIYTKHFPDELQGCFIRVRYKPVNTVEIHKWVEKDTHFEEERIGHVWQSANLSFIPVDVRFGPRGDLFVCDWYNPVKGHAQYSLRDTRRDKTSGRIWRITAKGRPLDTPPKIAGEPISKLLDLLKAYEYRTRYTAKIELRERDARQVKSALDAWVKKLGAKDPRREHHLVEAMWMYANLREPNVPLLASLLKSTNHQVRAAATRQMRWWHEQMPDAVAALRERANDKSGLVRLEAAIAASYFQLSAPERGVYAASTSSGEFASKRTEVRAPAALDAALDLLKHPMGEYLDHALRSTVDSLKPFWSADKAFLAKHPDLPAFIARTAPQPKRVGPKKGEKPDPFDKLNPQVVNIGTVNERMLFTVLEFKVKAGAPVKLILENPDATPHNLVLCQPGSEDKIGEAANEMAKLPDAFEKMDFLPKSDQIIAATKMVQPNGTDTLRFHAPKAPGRYPYICSFPGHYLVMKGVMVVE
ncbi:MAG: HEAT repeat domain-containing protein [Verrucomicrobia bacterium]|nr:HEAT repeat domain-containing protein [Verrucomicrobiota bacterium]